MKKVYRHITVVWIAVFFVTVHLQAQDEVERIWNQVDSISHYTEKPETVMAMVPWSFNTTVGTSFGYSPLFGSAMNLYAAPHARYKANDRLSFHGGILVSQTLPLLTDPTGELPGMRNMMNISAFVSASYHLTENLVLHGAGVRSIAHFPMDNSRSSPNYQDMSVGATYHFGNFSIGASFHKSNHSLYRSPFGYGNSFYGSPFGYGSGMYGPPYL
jgi:hypothetical protein